MPTFIYTAKDAKGLTQKGSIDASSAKKVAELLAQNLLIPISIDEKKVRKTPFDTFFQRVSGRVLAGFTRQFATMVSAGLPITQALQTLAAQTDNQTLRRVLDQVVADIEGGAPLSVSLSKHPNLFSSVYINLVRVGEASGKLDQVLINLAEAVERSYEFRARVKSAMIYPFMIVIVMIAVFGFLFIFVVPKLKEVYESFNATLPFQTRLVIAISDLMVQRGWLFLLMVGGAYYGIHVFKKTPKGRIFFATLALKLPVLGTLRKNIEVTEFTRTLGLLVQSGVPILQSLEIATESVTNAVYKDGILAATKQVERGVSLSVALSTTTKFPPMLIQMVNVGEQTGKLDDVLSKLSAFLQKETDSLVQNLSTALEPIILVSLGAMVGFLVMSIILPIYNLTSSFK